MTEGIYVNVESSEPYTVELSRGQRGGYGWTIKVRGKDSAQVMNQIHKLDQELKDLYLVESQKGEG